MLQHAKKTTFSLLLLTAATYSGGALAYTTTFGSILDLFIGNQVESEQCGSNGWTNPTLKTSFCLMR